MRIHLFNIIFLITVLVFGFCYQAQAQKPNKANKKTESLEQRQSNSKTNKESYSRRGIVVAKNRIRINSQVDATISRLHTEEGAQFQKNDLLIEFDCSTERTALEEARLSHTVAKSDFNAKKREAEETPISPQTLELLKLKTELALTKLNHLRTRTEHCRLFAPFSGRVLKILMQEHETVTALAPIMEIVDDQVLHFRVFLPWTWLKWLSLGDSAMIHILDTDYPAELVELSQEVDPIDQSIKALLKFQSQDNLILGMNGIAKFKEFK